MHHRSFFGFIETYFGRLSKITMKKWIRSNYKLIKCQLRLLFLKKCLENDIFPNHIKKSISIELNFVHFKNTNRMNIATARFYNTLLKSEINDTYRRMYHISYWSFELYKKITFFLPRNILDRFVSSQHRAFSNFYYYKKNKLLNKIEILHSEKIKNRFKSLSPIKYFVKNNIDFSNNVLDNSRKSASYFHREFEYSSRDFDGTSNKIMINVRPNSFNENKLENPFKLRDKWFLNLSNQDIPTQVAELVQLGERFSLPVIPKNKNKIVLEVIKDVERNIRCFDEQFKYSVRNYVVANLERFMNNNKSSSNVERLIIDKLKSTSIFLSKHPNVIFTRADKGNCTVALNKTDYLRDISLMLEDQNTYEVITRDPLSRIESDLNDILKRWVNKGFISQSLSFSLRSSGSNLPRAYGLPKIHKRNIPYRLIVSSVNSPLHSFALFLHRIIHQSIPCSPFYIKDSFHLFNVLSGLTLNNNYTLCSLDVVSLFTNVPLDLALKGVESRWKFIRLNTKISKDEFLLALRFVLSSTFFTFNDIIYKQTFGTPMGSPLSPIIADITLQDLELEALNSLKFRLPFYFRYVDDIVLAAPNDKIDFILNAFNTRHDRLKFTCELEENSALSFLDVKLMRGNGKIKCNWFHKPTFSGRYLNFYSHNPLCHKIGTIITLCDRAILLSHPEFQEENITLCIQILLNNNYPIDLIFKIFIKRIRVLFSSKLNNKRGIMSDNDGSTDKKLILVPFVQGITSNIKKIFPETIPSMISFRNIYKLNNFIKGHKDKITTLCRNNVVYRISCDNCNFKYVGQTKRHLGTRVKEHSRNVSHGQLKSAVAEHSITEGHNFKWNNVEILDIEADYHKRLISEMLFIKFQTHSLNRIQDTELLDEVYFPLLGRMSGF